MALMGRIARSTAAAGVAVRAGNGLAGRGRSEQWVVGEQGRRTRSAGEIAVGSDAPNGVRGRFAAAAALVIITVVSLAPPAHSAPRVVPGWPVVAPTGAVFPGPGSGPVVIGGAVPSNLQPGIAAVAFRRDGVRGWARLREVGCGNCDLIDQPLARRVRRHCTDRSARRGSAGRWTRSGAVVPGVRRRGAPGRDLHRTPTRVLVGQDASRPRVQSRSGDVVNWSFEEPVYRLEPWGGASGSRSPCATGRAPSTRPTDSSGAGSRPGRRLRGGTRHRGTGPARRARRVGRHPGSWRRLADFIPLAALFRRRRPRSRRGHARRRFARQNRPPLGPCRSRGTPPRPAAFTTVRVDTGRGVVYVGDNEAVVALDALTGATGWRTSARRAGPGCSG